MLDVDYCIIWRSIHYHHLKSLSCVVWFTWCQLVEFLYLGLNEAEDLCCFGFGVDWQTETKCPFFLQELQVFPWDVLHSWPWWPGVPYQTTEFGWWCWLVSVVRIVISLMMLIRLVEFVSGSTDLIKVAVPYCLVLRWFNFVRELRGAFHDLTELLKSFKVKVGFW